MMKTYWKPNSSNHLVVTCPCCRTRFNEDLDEHSDYYYDNPKAVVYYLQTFHKFCGSCGTQLIKEDGSKTSAEKQLREWMAEQPYLDPTYIQYLDWVVESYKPNTWNLVLDKPSFDTALAIISATSEQ